jgi:hypothetical protein
MKASEKYLIVCVTVMTGAYLWLIWQYSRQSAGSPYNDETEEPEWSESGHVNDTPPSRATVEDLFVPKVKGLDYE